ncbi:MAG TPA: Ig-like domain-containing protein [Candidatus Saccharimonadales bacterium]|nr:Ig-like domain-containing protein [Candidatus Saccharimonadales bacterium]
MKKKVLRSLGLVVAAVATTLALVPQAAFAASCPAPAADYGSLTTNLSIPANGTYRLWSRIKVPDTTNTTYQLEVDGQNCYTVGGGGVAANAWVWVDYQSGTASNKVQLALNQGNHTLKMTGLQPGVRLDTIIAVTDLNCIPTDAGNNCNTPSDTTPPSVIVTAPTDGSTVTGTVKIAANATDGTGIQKVEFYANGSLVATDTSAPYEANWDTALTPNNLYTLTAKAFDTAGNFATDTSGATVRNGDTQPPTAPGSLRATAPAHNKVALTWTASTDNVGTTSYFVSRNNVPLAQVTGTTYTDGTVTANTAYAYQVVAADAAGNKSAASNASITTPGIADTQAPTRPTNLAAQTVSSSQINLTWLASTDNAGVTGYEVFRAQQDGQYAKVATVSGTTFGDAGLRPLTKYTYYVRAKDAAGNTSQNSNTTPATQTHGKNKRSELLGTVRNSDGTGIKGARIIFTADNKRHIYVTDAAGKYDINGLAGGTYLVTYEATGYNSATIIRPITDNARVAQNVTLTKK